MQRLRETLVDRGYFEAITYSFVDPAWQSAIDPEIKPVALANPLSAELSVMRTSLWPGLLKAVQHNLNRQQPRVRLFETGLTFVQQGDELVQQPKIAAAICGNQQAEQWGDPERQVDFFDLKADLEVVLGLGGLASVEFVADSHPALHPGQTAKIIKNNQQIGWIGALHPQIQKTLDIDPSVYVFEIDQKLALEADVPLFSVLSKFPEVRRDIAILIDEKTPVEAIFTTIREVSSEFLQEILLFDVYTGKGVDNGLKSVALGLILQGFSRTLTDEDIEKEMQNIVASLIKDFGATLRE